MRDCFIVSPDGHLPADQLLSRLLLAPGRSERLTHVETLPARAARHAPWPGWADPRVVDAYARTGIDRPWLHQVSAAEHAWAGRHVVMATGTASGKSLGYALPALTAAVRSTAARNGRGATALYLCPTKALANDQLAGLATLDVPGVRVTTFDGDSPRETRDWARDHAHLVLTNPDMLHRTLLPGHARWAGFLAALRFVVVDECHYYRGLFGAHVAQVLRRLRRLCSLYDASPTFILASATVADPAASAGRLIGTHVVAVTEDGSPRGARTIGLWEPPLTALHGENDAPVRRSVTAEAADLLADCVIAGVRTLAFVRSRRGAEVVARTARSHLGDVDEDLVTLVAAYRGGYLPEDRRELEQAFKTGRLLGLSATNALELGIDIAGLDVVLIAGFPGTRASLWQQVGRAGRTGGRSLALLLARDDPLDTYLVTHPEALFGQPVESSVFDIDNPYVLGPHLCAAAQESPLTDADLSLFGSSSPAAVESLVGAGWLRRRPRGWFWTRRDRASDLADIRSTGGQAISLVEEVTGRLVGTVDAGAAQASVHAGAVYLHLGVTYVVRGLDLVDSVAVLRRDEPDYSTTARDVTHIRVLATDSQNLWGDGLLCFGSVEVTTKVVSFLRRRLVTGEVIGEEPLDLPERTLATRAVWWTLADEQVASSGVEPQDVPGAAHAAEHASIGLLPLFATCDRWDIGGVSTARHEDTGRLTVFVYDGYAGGAGFAERGFEAAVDWLRATREAIRSCACADGCPSCVQSPKCGNGNNPLDKLGAVCLLDSLLAGRPADQTSHADRP